MDRGTLEGLLTELGAAVPEMTLHMLGGGVMVLRGLKKETVDLDFIVENEGDRKKMVDALINLGFREYASMRFERRHGAAVERVDIDVGGFLGTPLTDGIRSRSELRKFGRADVRLLSNEDILLFKATTGRYKDLGDVHELSRGKIDWDVVLSESTRMKRMGVTKASPGIIAITLRHVGVSDSVIRKFERADKQFRSGLKG